MKPMRWMRRLLARIRWGKAPTSQGARPIPECVQDYVPFSVAQTAERPDIERLREYEPFRKAMDDRQDGQQG